MSIEIKPLTTHDYVNKTSAFKCALDCINIACSVSHDYCIRLGKKNINYLFSEDELQNVGLDFSHNILIAYLDDIPSGALHYNICFNDFIKTLFVSHLGVLPQYRRKGVGLALLNYVFNDESINVEEYQVGLISTNQAAYNLYVKAGFNNFSTFMYRSNLLGLSRLKE